MEKKIIKSKTRVQKHGEVFTPSKTVEDMMNLPGINDACNNLTTTFLEPSAGEGAFLVEVLNRKLNMVKREYDNSIRQYENYSLLVLSTLYGVELLGDNARTCVMNLFQVFFEHYQSAANRHNMKMKSAVNNSAKTIIAANIRQGNFLEKTDSIGETLVFSEWKALNLVKIRANISIQRTEFTLEEIYAEIKNPSGSQVKKEKVFEQLDIFGDEFKDPDDLSEKKEFRYVRCPISEIYKEEMVIASES